MMDFPPGLSALSDRYDVVLCDVWGVIHNGVASFPEACAALTKWGQEKGPVVLISNSPRPSADVVAQLDSLGVPRSAWNGFVTSGDATRSLLKTNAPGKVWKIGPERDEVLYDGIDLTAAGCEDADYAAKTSFGERIAHGMLSAGYISAVLGTTLPGPGAIYLSQALRFKRPVKIGDEVTARATITEIDEAKARVTFSTVCLVNGKPVVDGEAVVMVPRKAA